MSRLEELEKAFDEALEKLQKALDAWHAYGAAYDTADAAFCKAREKLEDYVEEYGYE
jgi:outer membrane protein TolC